MLKRLAACIILLGLSACASLPAPQPQPVEFVVIGDTPYVRSDGDRGDSDMLKAAVPQIHAAKPDFIVHVGDIQGGGEVCGPPDARFARLIADLSPIPVVYTPGDNEWTDCDRKDDPATGKPFSELQRLEGLRKDFFSGPGLPLNGFARQSGQPENARFLHGGLVWVTVNVVGSNNGRDEVAGDDLTKAAVAADLRDRNNVAWLRKAFAVAKAERALGVVVIMQADMVTEVAPESLGHACRDVVAKKRDGVSGAMPCDGFFALRSLLPDLASQFTKPVFLIHGDTAPFRLTQGPDNIWELNAAGDVWFRKGSEMCGVRDVTRVVIDLSRPVPIRAEGLLTGELPRTTRPTAQDCK